MKTSISRCEGVNPFVPSRVTNVGRFISAVSFEKALTGACCVVFLLVHDVFRSESLTMMKDHIASSVVAEGKEFV